MPARTNIPKSIAPSRGPVNTVDTIQKFNRFKRDRTLTGEDSKLQERSIKKYLQNKDKLIQEYGDNFGDKVVNTDLARRLFADIGYNGKNSAAVHEASSALTKDMWKKALSNPQSDAVLYAGCSGSGKTTAVKGIMRNIEDDAAAVLDGNLSSLSSAVSRIKEAVQAGKKPKVVYVYRDPVDAWVNGVVKRMRDNKEEGGRVVPMSVFLQNAPGSLDVARKLKEMNIPVVAIDNSRGHKKARLMGDKMLANIKYPDNLKETLMNETRKLLKARVITPKEYESLTR
jgi:hypothetical protein